MTLVWSLWLSAIIISFAGLEVWAVMTHQSTLSAFMATLGAKWPPLLVVYGLVFGGLAVHFWWRWTPNA